MTRLAQILAFAGAVLFAAAPALAAKPVPLTAEVTIDNQAPAYGDHITLTATLSAAGTTTGLHTVCTHEFGTSQSSITYHSSATYTDAVGLYAQNWPSGGATCVASVEIWSAHGRTQVAGQLGFIVAP